MRLFLINPGISMHCAANTHVTTPETQNCHLSGLRLKETSQKVRTPEHLNLWGTAGKCFKVASQMRESSRGPQISPINPKAGHSLHSPSSLSPALTQFHLAHSLATRELVGNKKETGLRRRRGTICERWGGPPFPPFLRCKGKNHAHRE